MTDSYATYNDVIDLTNKEENGYLTTDLFNRLSVTASRHVFNEYQARLQNPATARAEKQKLLDRLFPFIVQQDIAIAAGFADRPTDYAYFSSAKCYFDNGDSLIQLNALYAKLCLAMDDPSIDPIDVQDQIDMIVDNPKLVQVQLLDSEQVARRLNSFIPGKRPSLKKPIMEREGGRFHIYPENEASLFLWYYRRPKPSNLVMTTNPATLQLDYNLAASTGFEWGSEAMNDVVNKIVHDFSVHIREQQLFEMNTASKAP